MTDTLCHQCAKPIPAHDRLPTDCLIPHPDHAPKFVGLLCRRHYNRIGEVLSQIVELFGYLPLVTQPTAGNGEIRGTGSTESRPPLRLEVVALTDAPSAGRKALTDVPDAGRIADYRREGVTLWRDDPDAIPPVPWVLASWCRIVEEECESIREDTLSDGTVTSSVRFLKQHRHWIAQQLWVDDYVTDLDLLHRALGGATGAGMWPKPLCKCPNCARPVYLTVGVDAVTCTRCGSAWEGVALARLMLIAEQDAQKKAVG